MKIPLVEVEVYEERNRIQRIQQRNLEEEEEIKQEISKSEKGKQKTKTKNKLKKLCFWEKGLTLDLLTILG